MMDSTIVTRDGQISDLLSASGSISSIWKKYSCHITYLILKNLNQQFADNFLADMNQVTIWHFRISKL